MPKPSFEWVLEPLGKEHDRTSFDCGEPALNDFLKKLARQQQTKHLSRTFVAIRKGDPSSRVLGFYSLSAGSISFRSLPDEIRSKLPQYPIPAARLGRLASDLSVKGQGMGGSLLKDALLRVANVSSQDMGILAVIVDAKNDDAKRFYLRYGFQTLADNPLCLFMLTQTIRDAVK